MIRVSAVSQASPHMALNYHSWMSTIWSLSQGNMERASMTHAVIRPCRKIRQCGIVRCVAPPEPGQGGHPE